MKIPPLLSPEMIRKIHERGEANKTCTHGVIKHQYLLARTVFCSKCGHAMFGQTNSVGNRYYRHSRYIDQGECDLSQWVQADELERAVLVQIFATVGDAAGMEAAMLKAIPDRKKIEELQEQKKLLESELSKVGASRNRVINSIAAGTISDDEAKEKIK